MLCSSDWSTENTREHTRPFTLHMPMDNIVMRNILNETAKQLLVNFNTMHQKHWKERHHDWVRFQLDRVIKWPVLNDGRVCKLQSKEYNQMLKTFEDLVQQGSEVFDHIVLQGLMITSFPEIVKQQLEDRLDAWIKQVILQIVDPILTNGYPCFQKYTNLKESQKEYRNTMTRAKEIEDINEREQMLKSLIQLKQYKPACELLPWIYFMLKDQEQFNRDLMLRFPELYHKDDRVKKYANKKKKLKRNNAQKKQSREIKLKLARKNAARKEKERGKKAKEGTMVIEHEPIIITKKAGDEIKEKEKKKHVKKLKSRARNIDQDQKHLQKLYSICPVTQFQGGHVPISVGMWKTIAKWRGLDDYKQLFTLPASFFNKFVDGKLVRTLTLTSTDNVMISFTRNIYRPKTESRKAGNEPLYIWKKALRYIEDISLEELRQYKQVSFTDPGRRSPNQTITMDMHSVYPNLEEMIDKQRKQIIHDLTHITRDQLKDMNVTGVSNAEWGHLTGSKKRTRHLQKRLELNPNIMRIQNAMPTHKTTNYANAIKHLNYVLLQAHILLEFHASRNCRRLRMNTVLQEQKAWDQIINKMVCGNKDKCHLYVIGDSSHKHNSKCHASTFTGIRMARELWKRGLPYALVKEFRTSKLCSKCHHPVTSFKQSPKHVEDHIQTYDLNGLTERQISKLAQEDCYVLRSPTL